MRSLTESLIQKQTTLETLSTEKNSLTLQLERLEVTIGLILTILQYGLLFYVLILLEEIMHICYDVVTCSKHIERSTIYAIYGGPFLTCGFRMSHSCLCASVYTSLLENCGWSRWIEGANLIVPKMR